MDLAASFRLKYRAKEAHGQKDSSKPSSYLFFRKQVLGEAVRPVGSGEPSKAEPGGSGTRRKHYPVEADSLIVDRAGWKATSTQ